MLPCVRTPQTGKHDEAWMVLKHIHDTNMRARGEPERVFTVSPRRPSFPLRVIPPPPADSAVSPPPGEQDQGAQAAGRAGGDAERVGQPGPQGPAQDQDRAQSSTLVFFPPSGFDLFWFFYEISIE